MLEQELFDLLERTSDAVFSVTDQGEICSWNNAAEKLFGYPRAGVRDKTCYSLLCGHGALGAQVCGEKCGVRDSAAAKKDIPNFDLKVKTHSGQSVWVNVSTLVYENSRNHHRLIVHLMHDITVRRRNEELLRKVAVLSRQLAAIPDLIGKPAPISSLSDHEREILRLFSMGKNSKDIANNLGITVQTLRNHLHHINQKLHTHNRLEAVTHALQRNLV